MMADHAQNLQTLAYILEREPCQPRAEDIQIMRDCAAHIAALTAKLAAAENAGMERAAKICWEWPDISIRVNNMPVGHHFAAAIDAAIAEPTRLKCVTGCGRPSQMPDSEYCDVCAAATNPTAPAAAPVAPDDLISRARERAALSEDSTAILYELAAALAEAREELAIMQRWDKDAAELWQEERAELKADAARGRELLRELVTLKDMKDANFGAVPSMTEATEKRRLDYEKRKPLAWKAARAYLSPREGE
jgi:hypothetical protein